VHVEQRAARVPADQRAVGLDERDPGVLQLPLFEPFFRWMNGRIADEDRAVVESSGPGEVPPAETERSVGSDRATLQFRRYYDSMLRGRGAGQGGAPG